MEKQLSRVSRDLGNDFLAEILVFDVDNIQWVVSANAGHVLSMNKTRKKETMAPGFVPRK